MYSNAIINFHHQAYQDWVSKQEQEPEMLPDLDFDTNQLFFIGFAQVPTSSSLLFSCQSVQIKI